MEVAERCILVKNNVMVYKIPPRQSSRGYRAADWNLAEPHWVGRLRFIIQDKYCELRLEDKNNGELFAACPVDKYPGTSIESVTDSSRYFVICVKNGEQKAFLGLGFSDRSDSFDLNVTLSDHFKQIRKEEFFLEEKPQPSLNLAFKDGQTIRVALNIPKKESGNKIKNSCSFGLPLPLTSSSSSSLMSHSSSISSAIGNDDSWGDFTSASETKQPSGSWVQF